MSKDDYPEPLAALDDDEDLPVTAIAGILVAIALGALAGIVWYVSKL